MGKDLNRHVAKKDRDSKNHTKICSTSHTITELHIKLMRYRTTPIRTAELQIYDNINCWRVRNNSNSPCLQVG